MSEVKCSTCKGVGRLEFEQGQRRVPCVTCSGSGVDWRKTCEGVQQEAEVLRYDLQVAHSVINAHKPYFDAQRLRADTAEAELSKVREAYKNYSSKLVADALKSELAAAEQRIASHESTLRHFANCADVRQVGTSAMAYVAALNPNHEAESHE